MINDYMEWFLEFVSDAVSFLGSCYIVDGISLLHFMIAVPLLCIVVGGILIR